MNSNASVGRANRSITEILEENDTLRATGDALRSRLTHLEAQRMAYLESQMGTGLEARLEARLETLYATRLAQLETRLEALYATRLAQLETRLQAQVESRLAEVLSSREGNQKSEPEDTPGINQLALDACNLVLKYGGGEGSMIKILEQDTSISQRNAHFYAVLGLGGDVWERANMLQFKKKVARIYAVSALDCIDLAELTGFNDVTEAWSLLRQQGRTGEQIPLGFRPR